MDIKTFKPAKVSKKYFTEDFASLNDSRKIEEIMDTLVKIAYNNGIDDCPQMDTITAELAEIRKVFSKYGD